MVVKWGLVLCNAELPKRAAIFARLVWRMSSEKKSNFVWTDEETALLVQVVIDYKSSKSATGLDWETIKNKYEEITTRFQARYPRKETGVGAKEFPHCDDPTIITKERIAPKIKRIKANFRKAVDSGRKSGGGRIVLGLYDECYEIWAGSPAVESMPGGIETVTLQDEVSAANSFGEQALSPTSSSSRSVSPLPFSTGNGHGESETESEVEQSLPEQSTVKDMGEFRRNLVKHLQEKKDSKLTKKLAVDAQLLDTAKQELALKKRGIEMMEEGEKQQEKRMKIFENSMNTMTAAMSNGFNMLQAMFQQPMFQQPNVAPQQMQQHIYGHQQYSAMSAYGHRNNTDLPGNPFTGFAEQDN